MALTFVTGIVDAVSFLGLGQVFAGMMTGNVLFLGFGLAGTAGAPLVAPLVALGSFLAGGAAGGLLASRTAQHAPRGLALAAAIEVSLLGAAAVLAAVISVHRDEVSAYTLIALLALAMGVRHTIVRRIGSPELTTTVITVALTGLAAGSPTGWASGEHLARRSAAVLAMLTGALTGALLLESSLALPLAVAAAVTLTSGLAYVAATRQRGGAGAIG